MNFGAAKVIITPQNPVRLCGYATRTGPFEGVKEDIYIRVQIHQRDYNTLVFIYGDLLWWGSDFVSNMKEDLCKKFNFNADNVFFIASHNHSGPPTSSNFTSTLETYNEEYANTLKKKVIQGIENALDNMEEVNGKLYHGKSNLNVFRRVMVDGKIIMAPNYEVDVDKNLTIISLHRKDGSIKGLMIHYPCHANLSNQNYIQPDYPGVVLRMLDEKFPDSISIFLQGCTGDIRSNAVLGDRFIAVGYERVLEFANLFYRDCLKTLQEKPTDLTFNFSVAKKKIALYQENLKSISEITKMKCSELIVEREWADKVLEKNNRDYEIMEISKINYAQELLFLTFNSEISQYYLEFAKSLDKRIISIAYTNGMIGYISTKEQILEGGYEPEGSAIYFALSGTYKPEIEEVIHNGIKELIEGD